MTAPNVITAGVLALVPPFWGKPRIACILVAFLLEIQEIEDTIAQLRTLNTIDGADETRLRRLGAIVGEPSMGRAVERYRAAIRGKIAANLSAGRGDDLRRIAGLVIPGAVVKVDEGPAAIRLTLLSPAAPETLPDAARLLGVAGAGGVHVTLATRPAAPFTLAGPGALTLAGLDGPGDIGGSLGWVVETD
jgi:hypothetical protein